LEICNDAAGDLNGFYDHSCRFYRKVIDLIEFLTTSGHSARQTGQLEVAPKNRSWYPVEKNAKTKKREITLFVMRGPFMTTVSQFYRKVALLNEFLITSGRSTTQTRRPTSNRPVCVVERPLVIKNSFRSATFR
jgi:hypothetical protein